MSVWLPVGIIIGVPVGAACAYLGCRRAIRKAFERMW